VVEMSRADIFHEASVKFATRTGHWPYP